MYGLPKIQKSNIIESARNAENSGIIKIFEPNDLKLTPIVGRPKCLITKLSQLIDILLRPFLKQTFLKCPKEVNEHIGIVAFDVINLYTSIPHQFGLRL